ncbi:hypothetical protein ACFRMQ_13255 [Kitasatospora sp. NPDC056783]|uniref:hypothetical protein n=1 Tax=Kitasatospora sp. NPDC056783 TaxID=3345943 RepID=UPI0036A6CA85
MPGRHRRPPAPDQARLPPDADLRLRAIAEGRTLTDEGVATLPGATHAYAYRTLYRPDGRVDEILERLAPGPLHPPPGLPPHG